MIENSERAVLYSSLEAALWAQSRREQESGAVGSASGGDAESTPQTRSVLWGRCGLVPVPVREERE